MLKINILNTSYRIGLFLPSLGNQYKVGNPRTSNIEGTSFVVASILTNDTASSFN